MFFSAELFELFSARINCGRGPVYRADPAGLLKPRLERRIPNISLSIILRRSRARINAAPRIEYLYAGGTINRPLRSTCTLDSARLSIYVSAISRLRNTDMTPLNRTKARWWTRVIETEINCRDVTVTAGN